MFSQGEKSERVEEPREVRILFLDDARGRGEVFLAANPKAVWVETAADCISRLGEGWDEVHLDHDLGDEIYVDCDREDCGMEVVRWLCREPRAHLREAVFTVHSHNEYAAPVMVMQLGLNGYRVVHRPFGTAAPAIEVMTKPLAATRLEAIRRWFRGWVGLAPAEDFGYGPFERTDPAVLAAEEEQMRLSLEMVRSRTASKGE